MGVQERIREMVDSDEVVLFMKGTRMMPRCGFSAKVVNILNELIPEYTTIDVLADPDVREGVKAFSDWPTLPQLYVKGDFIGGADIISEMFQNGDLYGVLKVEAPQGVQANVTVTDAAKEQFVAALEQADGARLRLAIDGRFRHDLYFGAAGKTDIEVESNGIKVLLDPASSSRAEGVVIDFVDEGLKGAGFKIDNPNAPPAVQQLQVEELKQKLDAGEDLHLFDVRTDQEREIAMIGDTRKLDQEAVDHILTLPKDAMLVFHCHTGKRSQSAAEEFIQRGYTNVYNLRGGIDAWATMIDDSVARY